MRIIRTFCLFLSLFAASSEATVFAHWGCLDINRLSENRLSLKEKELVESSLEKRLLGEGYHLEDPRFSSLQNTLFHRVSEAVTNTLPSTRFSAGYVERTTDEIWKKEMGGLTPNDHPNRIAAMKKHLNRLSAYDSARAKAAIREQAKERLQVPYLSPAFLKLESWIATHVSDRLNHFAGGKEPVPEKRLAEIISYQLDLLLPRLEMKYRPQDAAKLKEWKEVAGNRQMEESEFAQLVRLKLPPESVSYPIESVPLRQGLRGAWERFRHQGWQRVWDRSPLHRLAIEENPQGDAFLKFPNGVRHLIRKKLWDGTLIVDIPYGRLLKNQSFFYFSAGKLSQYAFQRAPTIVRAYRNRGFEVRLLEEGSAQLVLDQHHRSLAYALNNRGRLLTPDSLYDYVGLLEAKVPIRVAPAPDGYYYSEPIESVRHGSFATTPEWLGRDEIP